MKTNKRKRTLHTPRATYTLVGNSIVDIVSSNAPLFICDVRMDATERGLRVSPKLVSKMVSSSWKAVA